MNLMTAFVEMSRHTRNLVRCFVQVPLVIFKREKLIARKLEFEGIWIAEEPGGDELGLRWDRHVLSTRSFPAYYWDKFIKKKVGVTNSFFNKLFSVTRYQK